MVTTRSLRASAPWVARRYVGRTRARMLSALHPGLTIGTGVQIGAGARIRIEGRGSVVIADHVEIEDHVTLAAGDRGTLQLDARVFVGHFATLAAVDSVRIGQGTMIAEHVSIRDHDHAPDQLPSSGQQRVSAVHVGPDVWIASKATVLRGVDIGARAVIAAHAVVRDDVAADTVVGGIPATVLRTKAGHAND